MSVVRAGILFVAIVSVAVFFGFTKANPFSNHFELVGQFQSAQNLKNGTSEVRIAGVEVGRVKSVEPLSPDSPGAKITMEIEKAGLPIHEDAEMKVRPLLFLEGNYFVDLKPGSPSAPEAEDGHTIPITQTAIPVQFGDLLTSLQSDTRKDLRTALREYAFTGLNNGGAEGFNNSIEYWESAYRSSALVNDATLGTRPGDLSKVIRGQQRTLEALVDNPEALQGTITNLNKTANALAREDDALEAAIPALNDVLTAGPPALRSLNASLPSVRRFARDALPGVRSSGPTLDALIPFVDQLRRLVQPSELRGLVDDLRPTIPALARLNRRTVPILGESRALSACTNNVLIPWQESPIPNPDEPGNDNQLVMRQLPRSLVGLAGESRIHDADSPLFRVNFSGGLQGVFLNNTSQGNVFAALPAEVLGTRPSLPPTSAYPDFRPDIPCETQDPPNLEAAKGGPPDQITSTPADLPDITVPELLELRDRLIGTASTPEQKCQVKALEALEDPAKKGGAKETLTKEETASVATALQKCGREKQPKPAPAAKQAEPAGQPAGPTPPANGQPPKAEGTEGAG